MAMKDEQVEREHRQHEQVEAGPHPELIHGYTHRFWQRHESLPEKEKGESLAHGLCRRSCEGLAFPDEVSDRTVRRGAVLTIRPRGVRPPRSYSPSEIRITLMESKI
jgi:hypothetical protein